jgi:hypothetical protein
MVADLRMGDAMIVEELFGELAKSNCSAIPNCSNIQQIIGKD